ncbi:alpha,alpha-phosphotrehalase [Saccharibacillus sp. JS10]|uniref:alpha,alpha-phosphotrehalase n=1 Tax=Saccharibacillus sp. JS10 TaxID=2950552 RepID=UPI00210EB3B6|nr:alpha,alpha-phosphotrehalase [Saccharibacillus sp. JS10]MCQ4085372.1 alpha,alpha-phosphotrehalase [Saccharibacillus sp. JS10]
MTTKSLENQAQWWRKSTVYQVYPRSFNDTTGSGIGDIRGLTEKLDYLQDLGIDIVWLQPVYNSPQNDNGYDVSDYRSIDPMYGTMDDFDELMDELRKRDMHLMLDIVVNHSSTEHEWFQQSRLSKDNPYRDYYIWRDPAPGGGVPNNWQSKFGGSAWQYDEATGQYFLALFDKTQADLNWENKQVRKEAADLMRFWADKGVDGFRMDVINLISKDQNFPDDDGSIMTGDGRRYYTDGPKVHEYIKELYEQVYGPYDLVTVGEMSSTTMQHCIRYSNPEEREFSMTFNFHHLKVDYPQGKKWELMPYDFEALKGLLSSWQVGMNEGGGWNALFWNNHDQPRALSRFADDGQCRVASAKMLATTLHGLQGTPYVFQGEEIGMPNPNWNDISEFRDIESTNMYRIMMEMGKTESEAFDIISKRSRDNARTPMQWNYGGQAGFTDGTPWIKVDERYPEINVKMQREDPSSVFHHYRNLIALRKTEPVLIDGRYVRLDEAHPQVFAYARINDTDTLLVLSNFSSEKAVFTLPEDYQSVDQGKLELVSGNSDQPPVWGKQITLDAYGSFMWIIRG